MICLNCGKDIKITRGRFPVCDCDRPEFFSGVKNNKAIVTYSSEKQKLVYIKMPNEELEVATNPDIIASILVNTPTLAGSDLRDYLLSKRSLNKKHKEFLMNQPVWKIIADDVHYRNSNFYRELVAYDTYWDSDINFVVANEILNSGIIRNYSEHHMKLILTNATMRILEMLIKQKHILGINFIDLLAMSIPTEQAKVLATYYLTPANVLKLEDLGWTVYNITKALICIESCGYTRDEALPLLIRSALIFDGAKKTYKLELDYNDNIFENLIKVQVHNREIEEENIANKILYRRLKSNNVVAVSIIRDEYSIRPIKRGDRNFETILKNIPKHFKAFYYPLGYYVKAENDEWELKFVFYYGIGQNNKKEAVAPDSITETEKMRINNYLDGLDAIYEKNSAKKLGLL